MEDEGRSIKDGENLVANTGNFVWIYRKENPNQFRGGNARNVHEEFRVTYFFVHLYKTKTIASKINKKYLFLMQLFLFRVKI